jgi:hypothetical protein
MQPPDIGTTASRIAGAGDRLKQLLRVVLAIADGVLEVQEPGAERVDWVLSADPALTGRILARGRRPWLGFKLPGLFRSP